MAATFKKAEGLSRHNSWRRVQSPGIACLGTRGPAAPSSQCGAVIPACFPVPLPSSERGESRTGKGVKAGQGRADALPAPSLAAALVPAAGELWAGAARAVLAPEPLAHPRHSQRNLPNEQIPALLHTRHHHPFDCQSHRVENVCGFGEGGCRWC